MKKIAIVLAAGLAVFALAGCGNGQATSEKAVAELANPWADMDTLEAAEEAAGFEIEIPAAVMMSDELAYRYCAALQEIEVQFTDPAAGYLRKAKDTGDISGDYQDYSATKELDADGIKITVKGIADDSYNLAVWQNGDYSYCIGLDEGVSADEMQELAAELK